MSVIQQNGHYPDSDDSDTESVPVELEPWVRIQSNTFTNWINDKLRVLDLEVTDLGRDFRDGVKLCRLMEVLKGRGIGRVIVKKRLNHYEGAGNLALALQAMKADGVRLVNIGTVHKIELAPPRPPTTRHSQLHDEVRVNPEMHCLYLNGINGPT